MSEDLRERWEAFHATDFKQLEKESKEHQLWASLGGPEMPKEDSESLIEEIRNPIVLTKQHLFITIALPSLPLDIESKREKVFEHLEKLTNIKYKYLKEKTCHYCFEFNSFDKKLKVLKTNYHIHFLVSVKIKNFTRSRIIRDFSRLFKVEPNFVDVIYQNSKELFEKRLQYIQNVKSNPEKCLAIEKDNEERKEIGIQNYYSHDIL